MCEWLSCREWCDVRLLCGGRTFSAHRAVLASVSAFLRRILLSCPTEESPTFIVLPDFDIEAMSSVLYYIYNGEVVVQKDKLEMFLDIIKAMQIFIDERYLPKTYDIGNQPELYSRTSKEEVVSKHIVFSLETEKCANQQYVNVKKGDQIRDILLQYSFGVLDNQQVRCQDWSEHQASLGNLQAPYEDRQRSSFLRDLFIETYPRNGNANGGSAGVLAISNERYRAPTSVLLSNANGKHLSNTLLEASDTRIDAPVWTNNFHEMKYGHDNPLNLHEFNTNLNINQYHLNGSKQLDPKLLFGYYNTLISKSKSQLTNSVPFLNELAVKHLPSLDLSVETFSRSLEESETRCKYLTTEHKKSLRNIHKIDDSLGNGGLVKGTILNQVLESPWCPRLPQNFRPFRRKTEESAKSCISDEKKSEADVSVSKNDKNNNIPSVTNVEESTATFSPFDDKESSKISYSVACLDAGDLKCTICNQVFTSADSLNIHMRRHSSTARYTCGECSKSFSQLRNFKYHMSIHRGTREFAATCTVCGKYFNDRGYLSSHMKIHRNRKEYKCSQCPKSFNQRVAYNMHVRIHTGVKPHVCEECGKAFSRKMLLKQHQRTHSGERPYACPHCDKRFADRSNMTLHLRLHTGVKPFSCTLCPKSFTKKHHLKSHLNFHTGAKPYSCPRCKLAFTQSSNMRTHYKKCSAPEHAEGESKLVNS